MGHKMTACPKQHHIKDLAYRKSFKGEDCLSCGANDGTVVGAHMRWNEFSGMGRKPSDALIVPLCGTCHADQEANPGPEWWVENVLKSILRRRYLNWTMK